MDTEVLNAIPDCKNIDKKGNPCQWWYETSGECRKPSDVDCPKGVRQPQQEYAEE